MMITALGGPHDGHTTHLEGNPNTLKVPIPDNTITTATEQNTVHSPTQTAEYQIHWVGGSGVVIGPLYWPTT